MCLIAVTKSGSSQELRGLLKRGHLSRDARDRTRLHLIRSQRRRLHDFAYHFPNGYFITRFFFYL